MHLVEITAYSDDDAYTIFETMNDRGLSLSPTDMLKGYLLANIDDETKRRDGQRPLARPDAELNEAGKEVETDSFKTWLRSQYANKIRERRKGARPEDFDRIGTEFHRWVREASSRSASGEQRLLRVHRPRLRLLQPPVPAAHRRCQETLRSLQHVLYNAQHGFPLCSICCSWRR